MIVPLNVNFDCENEVKFRMDKLKNKNAIFLKLIFNNLIL
jgi:hypothetical protein